MPYISLDDFNMYYEEVGAGEPILFIHGSLTTGAETFQKQLAFFKEDYRCICMDLRSHGKSRCSDLNWNTETLSGDVIALLNELNIHKAHLVGHSMGGDVAMYCAVNHPERVQSITVISSAGMVNPQISSYLEQLCPDKIDSTKFAKFITKMHNLYGETWKSMVSHTIWNCNHYPCFSSQQLRQLDRPFLLIRGSLDEMVLDSEIEILQRAIPNFKYIFIENGNHFLHSSSGTVAVVNEAIKAFVKGE